MSNYNNAPPELRALPWVNWKLVLRGSKWTKVPVMPTGAPASVTDSSTWSTFDECIGSAHKFSGIGFVLRKADGHVVIDGDATDDPHILDAHRKVFAATRSYAETSPSGKGFHIILKGNLAGPGRRRHGVEMYDDARFFTFTGDVIDGRTEILGGPEAQAFIDQLYQELGGSNGAKDSSPENREQTESDPDICERLRRGANGAIFDQLFAGAWDLIRGIDGSQKYPSQSEADQAFANLIFQQTGNIEQFERIFHASGLGQRAKAHRPDYLRRLAGKGLDRTLPQASRERLDVSIATSIAAHEKKRAQTPLNGVHSALPAAESELRFVRLGDVIKEPVRWLWRNWIAKQKMHVMYGAPEAGKSTTLLSLGAILSQGALWPDGTQAPVGNVLIWSSEDRREDTLAPRLYQMGGHDDRIRFVDAIVDKKTGKERSFKPSTDMPQLIAALDHHAKEGWKPDIIVIDPLVAMQAAQVGKGSQNSNIDTRAAIDVLADLSISHDCAVIGIHHASKGTQGRNLVERASGSLAVGAVPRLMLYAIKNPKHDEDPDEPPRILGRAKGNIGKPANPIGYAIKDGPIPVPTDFERGYVEWLGEIEGTMQEIVDEAEKKPDDTNGQRKADVALDWLRENILTTTGVAEIEARAREAGVNFTTLRRAAKEFVDKNKDGRGGWTWTPLTTLWAEKPRRGR